jgi:hypothetical protein
MIFWDSLDFSKREFNNKYPAPWISSACMYSKLCFLINLASLFSDKKHLDIRAKNLLKKYSLYPKSLTNLF